MSSDSPSSLPDNPDQPRSDNTAVPADESLGQNPKNRAKSVWLYVALRLLFFLAPLGILLAIDLDPWFSAIAAALIGFALSLLLLQRQRDPLVEMVYQRGNSMHTKPVRTADEDFEDSIIDENKNDELS